MSQTYLLWPSQIHILKGKDAKKWKHWNTYWRTKYKQIGYLIDGIIPGEPLEANDWALFDKV